MMATCRVHLGVIAIVLDREASRPKGAAMSTVLAFTRAHLASIARELACRQLAGDEHQAGRAIEMFLAHFRNNPTTGFPWGAAFVYHCVRAAGFDLPPSQLPEAAAFVTVHAWT